MKTDDNDSSKGKHHSPILERVSKIPPESSEERDRRIKATQCLKEQLLQTPFYAERAKYHRERFGSDKDYWDRMYASCAAR